MVWYWFPKLCYIPQIRFLFLDNGAKPFLKFYILWLYIYLLFFEYQLKPYNFFLKIVHCSNVASYIIWFHCAWTKGRSWVGTNWLLVTTVELTGGLYMIWIMALWIIFELLLSAKHFLLYIFCSMAMELFDKVKVFRFEWFIVQWDLSKVLQSHFFKKGAKEIK